MTITTTEYGGFQRAFDWFNRKLFEEKLPPCLITLQRKARARGYYSADRFHSRTSDHKIDEIALNPATFAGWTDIEILSTLVHEMVHQYQRLYGSPGRGRYHNREWANMMIKRGLMPSNTGEPGGQQTGDRMSHYILQAGLFQRACQKLLATGFKLNWQEKSYEPGYTIGSLKEKASGGKKDRLKFTCAECGQNAWAKPSAALICGACYRDSQVIQVMRNPNWDADFINWTDRELAGLSLVHSG